MKQSREKFNPVMLRGSFGFLDDVSGRGDRDGVAV